MVFEFIYLWISLGYNLFLVYNSFFYIGVEVLIEIEY